MKIRTKGSVHQALNSLLTGPKTLKEISATLRQGFGMSMQRVKVTVTDPLCKAGMVQKLEDDSFKITDDGISLAAETTRKAASATPSLKGTPANLFVPKPGNYDGAELRRVAHRPGAFDYADCPSLVNGQFIPYKAAHVTALATPV